MFILTMLFQMPVQSQMHKECGGVINDLPEPLSTCVSSNLEYWLENHVTKEIAMRFIIVRRSDGSGNFQEDDELHQEYLNGLEAGINSYYSDFKPKDASTGCNVYNDGESYIRFKLSGITYLDEDAAYNLFAPPPATNSSVLFYSLFQNYGVNKTKEINIFFVEALYSSNAGAIANTPGFGSSSGGGQLPFVFMFRTFTKIELEFKPNNYPIEWMINEWTLSHELGHCLNLPDLEENLGSPTNGTCDRFMVTQWGNPATAHNTITINELGHCHKSLTERTVSSYVRNCPYSIDYPIEVTSNETWNCYMRVYSDIMVMPGASLTLKNLLLMPKDARISVMPGAKLIVDGGTVSNGCDNERWQGIQILGNPDEPHPAEPFNPLTDFAPAHGIAYLYNNAKIENARIGVATAMLNNQDGIIANTGGIIWAEGNTLFKNNQVGVLIANPNNALLRISHIQNCRFEITDDYIAGTGIYGQPVGIASRSGKLYSPIKNNVFINLQSIVETKQRGIGIFNTGTGMRVGETGSGNRFENLYKGIDYYAGPSLTSVISVQNNDFLATNKALTLNGGIFAQIENNHFDVTHFGNNIDGGYGIFTERASGYYIGNNSFTCSDASPNLNVALELRRDIDYAAGTVTENSFSGTFAVANIFSGKNPNLIIDCNQYNYPINMDWLIIKFNPTDYLNDQGICEEFEPKLARRNSFKPNPNGIDYLNIYNATNADFTYRAQSAVFAPTVNVEIPGGVDVFECFENEQQSHCAFDDPCNPDCWQELLSQTNDPEEQKHLYTGLIQERLYLQQTAQAKTDLEELQRAETDKILVATYTDEADSINAMLKLADIPLDNIENIEFVNLYLQILNGIQPPAGPGKTMSEQETLLRSLANNERSTQNTLAQSLIAAHYAETFDKTPLAPPKAKNSPKAEETSMYVYPNPANTQVQIYITLPEIFSSAKLYVLDLQGRIIDQLPVVQPNITLQIADYPNGFYLLHLKTTSGALYTQKLAVIR
ncbi:MAG: T9SS type A sorting domain-containing protein [Sphingobacteriales bacterium]|nr:MAG: T9SS type A sorting domain-containing protein [Sphingobacteriales bacterium]